MKPEFLNLFRELCEEQVMLYVDPEGVKAKKNAVCMRGKGGRRGKKEEAQERASIHT